MTADALDSILRFTRVTTERTADEVRRIGSGWAVRTPSLSAAWSLNHVRFEAPVGFNEAVAVADRELAHVPYRNVVIEDHAIEPGLEAEFIAGGWEAEHDLLMELVREPDREVDTSTVLETAPDTTVGLSKRWMLEARPETTAGELSELIELGRREARARGDRGLAVAGEDGDLAAMAKLRSDGETAQIEDVYTAPEARGRGFARAIVTRAVELAKADEHELIFIIADDNGWPKELYARIGFAPVGRLLRFHREPAEVHGDGTATRKASAANAR